MPQPDCTLDALFDGAVLIEQRRRGYRFNLDSVLLAAWAAAARPRRVLDVGTGSGVLALALAHLVAPEVIVAVEVQPALAELARRNVARNRCGERIEVREGDVRRVAATLAGPFDAALINPPYYEAHQGRINPDTERAAARHQLHGSLAELVGATAPLLGAGGQLFAVYPAEELGALIVALDGAALRRIRLRAVHSTADAPARMVLVAAQRRARLETTLEPPLSIYRAPDVYTDEVARILAGALPP